MHRIYLPSVPTFGLSTLFAVVSVMRFRLGRRLVNLLRLAPPTKTLASHWHFTKNDPEGSAEDLLYNQTRTDTAVSRVTPTVGRVARFGPKVSDRLSSLSEELPVRMKILGVNPF